MKFPCDLINLHAITFSPELLRTVPASMVRWYRILPVGKVANSLRLVMSDPTCARDIFELSHTLPWDLKICRAEPAQIDRFIFEFYGTRD